LRCCQKRLYSL